MENNVCTNCKFLKNPLLNGGLHLCSIHEETNPVLGKVTNTACWIVRYRQPDARKCSDWQQKPPGVFGRIVNKIKKFVERKQQQ